MIITLNNFIEEAKKYKAAFSITSVKEGTFSCFSVKFLHLLDDEGIPAQILITKEEKPRMVPKRYTLNYESLSGRTNGETMDNYFHKSLEAVGALNVAQLVEELPIRLSMGYTSWGFSFKKALLEQFKTMTLTQQKKFVEDHDLTLIKCFITKEWETLAGGMTCFVDSQRRSISRNGFYNVGPERYDYEIYNGYNYLWTRDTMLFYMISGQKISLYNIIKHGDNITECSDCHSLTLSADEICQTCHPGVTVESIYQQYSAKAERVFSFKSKKEDGVKPIFLGVELELENRTNHNLLTTWKTLKNHVIIKRDGSVSGGIELCSAPASITVHKEEFKPFFDIIESLHLQAKTNCGMHVHVDRSTLTELQIGKMLSFMYNKQNKKLINKIAGRKDNNYCSLDFEKGVTSGIYFDEGRIVDYRKKLHRSSSEGRYTGLNLSPPYTIEFRIFASTTSYEEFSKNLEFVQSMVDFTKPSAVNVTSLKDFGKQEVYLKFVKENRKTYPNLFQFLKSDMI